VPAHRLPMRKIREVLRLREAGFSARSIARSIGIGRTAANQILDRADAAGLPWPLPEEFTDADLERTLYPAPPGTDVERPLPDWSQIAKELRMPGVTLRLLWEEYHASHPEAAYRYSWFCEAFRQWKKTIDPVMRQEHKAGEKLFVDWAGQSMTVTPFGEDPWQAQIFAAALGASGYTYVEATRTQTLPDWIGAHVRALETLGGVPRILVPDNTRTAVKRPCYYEPELNRTYADLAIHYGMAIVPARVRRPRDKAKVESTILAIERRIMAPLRHRTFTSLAALNEAIAEQLDAFNARPFQKLEGSRESQFQEIDCPVLEPLPAERFEYAEWKRARAGIDYHVAVDGHHYSVPFQLIRKPIDVRVTAQVVECFHNGTRVAVHRRSGRKGKHTTTKDHMPSSHRRYAEWTPDRILAWAAKSGDHVRAACRQIMDERPHPEHGFRACMGLMRLGKHYGPERLDAACKRALASGVVRYRSIESILKQGLDRIPLEEHLPDTALPDHVHVRGPDYYN
jgi:transposase